MHRLGFEIDVCLASPKVRARDTALLACRHPGLEPEICPPIADGYYDTLELVVGRGNVMLVGHEPDMSSEVARLTGARVKLKKGGLAVLEPGQLRILMLPAELAIVARTWRKGPATGSLVPRSRRGPARPKVDSHGVL